MSIQNNFINKDTYDTVAKFLGYCLLESHMNMNIGANE